MTAITMNLKEMNKKYSPYKRLQDMNDSIWAYVDWLRDNEFPQSTVDVLLKLGKHSLRAIGLSFMHQQTIADGTGYSRQTVNTALGTLEKLGVVDTVDMLKVWGKKGNNGKRKAGKMYRIKPFNLVTLQQHFTSAFPAKTSDNKDFTFAFELQSISSEAPTLKKDVAAKADSSNMTDKPKTFYQRLKELAQARKGAIPNFSKLMNIIFGRMKKLKKEAVQLTHQQLENVMYQAFKALLSKENVHNDEAMLNAIMTNKLNDILKPAQQGAASTHSRGQAKPYIEQEPDWLEENRRQWAAKEAARQLEQAKRVDDEEDLEAYKQRVLAKLGLS